MTSIEYWRVSHIADELFIQMCNTYLDDSNPIKVRRPCKYRIRAAKYAGRISAGRFYSEGQYPVLVINKSDFTAQLREQIEILANEDPTTLAEIIDEVMYRIYDSSDRHLRLIYFRYIQARKFRCKLEE